MKILNYQNLYNRIFFSLVNSCQQMDKKIITSVKRPNKNQGSATEDDVSTYKNENVIFKIHSARGEQNYNAKAFPAKFSINICNEPTQLATGQYNREHGRTISSNHDYHSPRKQEMQNVKNDRLPIPLNQEHYEKQLTNLLEDKKQCDRLIMQLEETCHSYQEQNQQLINILNEKDKKINELEQNLLRHDKNERDLKDSLMNKEMEIRQLKLKIKTLESEIKRLNNALQSKEKENRQDLKQLENRISELQAVILQKQQTIKNLSNFNNQICKKILDEQSYSSSAHVKQMEKWLKTMKKKFQSPSSSENSNGKKEDVNAQNVHNALMSQTLNKNQYLTLRIMELQKMNRKLESDIKKMTKDNTALTNLNQQLKKLVNQYENSLSSKALEKDTQQSFFRRTQNANNLQDGTIIYQGTVKVKMQCLLLQKDKRISSLESELQDVKNQNVLLRSKIYQLDCEQQFAETLKNNQEMSALRKARSMGSFYQSDKWQQKSRNQNVDKDGRQITHLISQCNNLTSTLGQFLQSCKTERPTINDQFIKSQNSRAFYEANPFDRERQSQMQKMRELMQLQKTTFDMLEKNIKRSSSNFQQTKWNTARYNTRKSQKENPDYERSEKQENNYRRFTRLQSSSRYRQYA